MLGGWGGGGGGKGGWRKTLSKLNGKILSCTMEMHELKFILISVTPPLISPLFEYMR